MRNEIIANAIKEYNEFSGNVTIYNRKLHMAHHLGVITTEELHEIKRIINEIRHARMWGDLARLDRAMQDATMDTLKERAN